MLWFGMYDVVAHGNTPCRGIITSCLVQVLYLSWNGHNFGNDSYIIIRCIIRCVKKQSFCVNEIVWVYWQEAWRNNFDKDQNSFIWLPNTFLAMSPFWLAGSTPSTKYTVHSAQCIVHSTQYTVHSAHVLFFSRPTVFNTFFACNELYTTHFQPTRGWES